MSHHPNTFRLFLEQVTGSPSVRESISQAEASYNIRAYCIGQIDPEQALKLYESIYNKFYKNASPTLGSNWYQNQLRLFVWVLFCYLHLRGKHIEQLAEPDWHFFHAIFDRKQLRLFEYQCHCIFLENKGKAWTEDEDNLVKQIIKKQTGQPESQKFKWNDVSKLLFQQSGKKYLRTPKQCRERWNNHLDPSKVKGMWRREQCLLMFEYVQQHGKKWANIVKLLNHTRNEHSIKNKFNSLVKKQTKTHKDIPEEQLYSEIIARIKSAITNDRSAGRGSNSGFDLEDEVDGEIQSSSVQETKVSPFASKLMQKLISFGSIKSEANQPKQADHKTQPNTRQKIAKPQQQAPKPAERVSQSHSTNSYESNHSRQSNNAQDSFNQSLEEEMGQLQAGHFREENQFNLFDLPNKPGRKDTKRSALANQFIREAADNQY